MNAIQKLGDATRMLAEVRSAQDAKTLMTMAAAAEYYARKAKLGAEAVSYAHTIRVDAMQLLGGYLEKQVSPGKRAKDIIPDGNNKKLPPGVAPKESSAAQALHAIAKNTPELFEEVRAGKKTVAAARRIVHKVAVTEAAKLPSDKFRVIYADPPWKYGDQLTEAYGATISLSSDVARMSYARTR